jgi:hypothetical protein
VFPFAGKILSAATTTAEKSTNNASFGNSIVLQKLKLVTSYNYIFNSFTDYIYLEFYPVQCEKMSPYKPKSSYEIFVCEWLDWNIFIAK